MTSVTLARAVATWPGSPPAVSSTSFAIATFGTCGIAIVPSQWRAPSARVRRCAGDTIAGPSMPDANRAAIRAPITASRGPPSGARPAALASALNRGTGAESAKGEGPSTREV